MGTEWVPTDLLDGSRPRPYRDTWSRPHGATVDALRTLCEDQRKELARLREDNERLRVALRLLEWGRLSEALLAARAALGEAPAP